MRIGKKILDASILISFFVFSTIVILVFKPHVILSHLLYFVFPTVYLLIRYPAIRQTTVLFSLTLFVIFLLMAVVIQTNFGWYIPPTFPVSDPLNIFFQMFGWFLFWIFLVVSVYQVFVDVRSGQPKIGRKYKFLLALVAISFLAFVAFLPVSHKINFIYGIVAGLVIVPPLVHVIMAHPKLIPKIVKVTMVFFSLSIVYEFVGLKLGWWWFPGKYIIVFNFFGNPLPLEEIVLWISFGAAAVVSYYEEFVGDLK